MKVWFVRHQAAQVVWEYPFASEPTAEQLVAMRRLLEWKHGKVHPKTKEPLWLNVIAVDLVADGAVPQFDLPEEGAHRELTAAERRAEAFSQMDKMKIRATGRVRNPGDPR